MKPIRVRGFELRDRRLVVHGRPTLADWVHAVTFVNHVERNAQFWLGDLLNYGQSVFGQKYSHAVKALGLPKQTLENFAYVARNVHFSRRREVSFSIHAEIAPLTPTQQDRWLKRAADKRMSVAELRIALRLERRRAMLSARRFPAGLFRIVLADPPWQYEDVTGTKAAELHYPTMTNEAIAALPVREHVERDAVLFLWVPAPHIFAAQAVIEAWGFEHKTGLVWDKRRPVYGHYVAVQHEHLLICTRGSCTPDRPTPMPPSVQAFPRTEHSAKPKEFREMVDRLYPFGRRVELFARGAVPKPWIAWGNEAERAA